MTTDPPHTGPVSNGRTSSPPPPSRTEAVLSRTKQAARVGITMGSALAITISWSANKSILWAIIHGFFSWAYVIYYAIRY